MKKIDIVGQAKAKPKETLKKLTKPSETFSFSTPMELHEGEKMLQLASLRAYYFVCSVNEQSRKFGFCFDDDKEEFDEWIDTLLLKDETEEMLVCSGMKISKMNH